MKIKEGYSVCLKKDRSKRFIAYCEINRGTKTYFSDGKGNEYLESDLDVVATNKDVYEYYDLGDWDLSGVKRIQMEFETMRRLPWVVPVDVSDVIKVFHNDDITSIVFPFFQPWFLPTEIILVENRIGRVIGKVIPVRIRPISNYNIFKKDEDFGIQYDTKLTELKHITIADIEEKIVFGIVGYDDIFLNKVESITEPTPLNKIEREQKMNIEERKNFYDEVKRSVEQIDSDDKRTLFLAHLIGFVANEADIERIEIIFRYIKSGAIL
jgi:hypothetical protein